MRAPTCLPEHVIEQFVVQKRSWLINKINEQKALLLDKQPAFLEGAEVLYFGKCYTLKLVLSDREDVYLDETQNSLVVCLAKRQEKLLPQEEKLSVYVQSVFYRFLHRQANEYLPKLISELNLLTQLQHKHLVIKRYKARWGSCNNKAEISLNYLLMTCPDWVIRYVVIHELCHLKFLNHSANFWGLVAYFCPTYKEAKTWLRTHSFDIRS